MPSTTAGATAVKDVLAELESLGVCAVGRNPRVAWFRSLPAGLFLFESHCFHAGGV